MSLSTMLKLTTGGDGKYDSDLYKGMNPATAAAINAGVAMGSNIGGELIGGGLSSGAGNIMSGLSSFAEMIPGPAGAIGSAGLNILKGVTNRVIGSKINEEKVNEINANINNLRSFNANAGSFDDFMATQSARPTVISFSKSDIGKDGLFSNKAKNKFNKLKAEQAAANQFVQSSLSNNLSNLQENQGQGLLANFAAFGGPLQSYGADWSNGITIVNAGNTHEKNPYEGVMMGMDEQGIPNLVEEGEVIYNDYVYSNRLKVPKSAIDRYKLKGKEGMTFADAAKLVQKESEERPNDPISKRTLDDIMNKLMTEQETIRQKREEAKQRREAKKYAKGGKLGRLFYGDGPYSNFLMPSIWDTSTYYKDPNSKYTPEQRRGMSTGLLSTWNTNHYGVPMPTPTNIPTPIYNADGTTSYTTTETLTNTTADQTYQTESRDPNKVKVNPLTYLRYWPTLGAAYGVFSDAMGWTNKPDYSNANAVLESMKGAKEVKPTFIGDYLKYKPLDRLFYSNQLQANAAGTRRAIANLSGGNRATAMANIIGADYNAMNSLGNLYRKAEEYNAEADERSAKFNQATNIFNAESALKAQIASRESDKLRMDAAYKAAALRDAELDRASKGRSLNLTNLFDSLGDIGREAFAMDMIKNNRGLLYDWMGRYKGKILDDADGKRAQGGFLTIKPKRRK